MNKVLQECLPEFIGLYSTKTKSYYYGGRENSYSIAFYDMGGSKYSCEYLSEDKLEEKLLDSEKYQLTDEDKKAIKACTYSAYAFFNSYTKKLNVFDSWTPMREEMSKQRRAYDDDFVDIMAYHANEENDMYAYPVYDSAIESKKELEKRLNQEGYKITPEIEKLLEENKRTGYLLIDNDEAVMFDTYASCADYYREKRNIPKHSYAF